jgi:hypothetical protein
MAVERTSDHPITKGLAKVLRAWPDDRLQRLFDSSASRFWPGRLHGWRAVAHYICDKDVVAFCDPDRKRVVIDLTRCNSNRAVRYILLHEMCHAVTGGGHDMRFFAEVERLLRLGVPVSVDFSLYARPDAALVACAARASRADPRRIVTDHESFLDQEEKWRALLELPDDPDDGGEMQNGAAAI